MDKDKNQKSDQGNDKKLRNVVRNKVTGVKVSDDRKDNASGTGITGTKDQDKSRSAKA